MRYLTLAIFIFISFLATAQAPWLRPNSSYGTQQKRGAFDSTLLIPSGCGLPLDIKAVMPTPSQSAIYYDTCASFLYIWDVKTKKWDFVKGDSATRSYIDSISSLKLNKVDSNMSKGYVTPTYLGSALNNLPTPSVSDSSGRAANTAWVIQWMLANFGRFQSKQINYTGSTSIDTLTYPELIGQTITSVTRSGIGFKTITSGAIDSFKVKVNIVTGGVKFGMPINNLEEIVISYQATSALAAWQGGSQGQQVETYSEMIGQLGGSQFKIFTVKSDEVWGGNPGMYIYFNGVLMRLVNLGPVY